MIKKIGGAAVVAILVASAWYALQQHQRADVALARADSTAQASREALQEVQAWSRSYLQRWQDSAAQARRERRAAKREMEKAEAEFSRRMDALLATADSGAVSRPQLVALGEVHEQAISKCQLALSACETELRATSNQLSAYTDSIVPSLRRNLKAERALAEQAQRVASPGLFTRFGRNMEFAGTGLLIGTGLGIGLCLALCP